MLRLPQRCGHIRNNWPEAWKINRASCKRRVEDNEASAVLVAVITVPGAAHKQLACLWPLSLGTILTAMAGFDAGSSSASVGPECQGSFFAGSGLQTQSLAMKTKKTDLLHTPVEHYAIKTVTAPVVSP